MSNAKEVHAEPPRARASKLRVSVQIDIDLQAEPALESLAAMLQRKADAVLSETASLPAKEKGDLWVRAKVGKRVDVDGNLGFDLSFLGSHGGRKVRWPQLGRRCTLCTDGEFAEVFRDALFALIRQGIPEVPEPLLALNLITPTQAQPPSNDSPPEPPLRARVLGPIRSRPPASLRPRWWGWMGAGMAGAGAATAVVALVTMPSNVPVSGDPTRMYPRYADGRTKLGLALGSTMLVSGLTLWVVDRLRIQRCKQGKGSCASSRSRAWQGPSGAWLRW